VNSNSVHPGTSWVTFSCNVPFLIEIEAFVVRAIDINGKLVQFAWPALATIVFAVVVVIRMPLLGLPLERDQGRYAYACQLILQGVTAYKILAPQSLNSLRFHYDE
jgi:hypothetical protein